MKTSSDAFVIYHFGTQTTRKRSSRKREDFCYHRHVKLSAEAETYYAQAKGQRTREVEDWFTPAMNQAQNFMPRGGVRGRAISDLIVERFRRLVKAQTDSWVEAYDQYGIRLEKTDVEIFVSGLKSAHQNLHASLSHYIGVREIGTSTQLTLKIDEVIRLARQTLLFEATKSELKQRRIKEEKRMRKKQATIKVGGDVVGSVLQTGDKSKANLSVNFQLNQTLQQLRQEFERTEELESADKTEALRHIDKLKGSITKEQTLSRIQKIMKRFDIIVGFAAKTKELVLIADPLIVEAKKLLSHINW